MSLHRMFRIFSPLHAEAVGWFGAGWGFRHVAITTATEKPTCFMSMLGGTRI